MNLDRTRTNATPVIDQIKGRVQVRGVNPYFSRIKPKSFGYSGGYRHRVETLNMSQGYAIKDEASIVEWYVTICLLSFRSTLLGFFSYQKKVSFGAEVLNLYGSHPGSLKILYLPEISVNKIIQDLIALI